MFCILKGDITIAISSGDHDLSQEWLPRELATEHIGPLRGPVIRLSALLPCYGLISRLHGPVISLRVVPHLLYAGCIGGILRLVGIITRWDI